MFVQWWLVEQSYFEREKKKELNGNGKSLIICFSARKSESHPICRANHPVIPLSFWSFQFGNNCSYK